MSRLPRRAVPRLQFLLAVLLASAGSVAHADAGWFESGDTLLRMDLQLLNDARVIRYPLNQWPVPRAGVQYALANAKEQFATSAAVKLALDRVRTRAETRGGAHFDSAVRAGEPALLRDFDSLAREEGELALRGAYDVDRYSVGLSVTGVADPADGQEVRLDGSQATVKLGNWLLSANALERWWGPGHESSLILSNNARPMPTLMVERAAAMPFETRWLSWLGPWRFSFALSAMEHERQDIDAPLFMAWRVAIMPIKDIELGFSRTAQFCGEQLPCDLQAFGDMLVGRDNPGFNTTLENEPGNQMAGFDMRWSSPIGNGPYALYAQFIGEDVSQYVPAKYLSQMGLEVWKPMADGGQMRWFGEYGNTTCSGLDSGKRGPFYDCAYNQEKFNVEGYRYRGRSIGDTTDNDAESYAIGVALNTADSRVWSVTGRFAHLNHGGTATTNTVSRVPAKYAALEAGWRGQMFGEQISVDLGVEALEPDGGERDTDPFGFISWRHEFQP